MSDPPASLLQTLAARLTGAIHSMVGYIEREKILLPLDCAERVIFVRTASEMVQQELYRLQTEAVEAQQATCDHQFERARTLSGDPICQKCHLVKSNGNV